MRRRVRKFLSSTFNQPLGTRVAEGGYYVDLRVKARSSDVATAWPWKPGSQSWIAFSQYGLACNERWVAGEGEEWLAAARHIGDALVENQTPDGEWIQGFDLPHTYDLRAPWTSAMAQGEAASLLTRLTAVTGDERYSEAARRALDPMPMAPLPDGSPFPQEYPTDPPSHVLNGAIYALWGLHDAGDGSKRFEDALDVLVRNLQRWDTGSWSRYDLYPHPIANWASLAYHELHTTQLRALTALSDLPALAEAADRFESYWSSPSYRARALAHKAAFRIRVPR
jgi:heparosan-N-sulfate-glucuronate 5-epimerase